MSTGRRIGVLLLVFACLCAGCVVRQDEPAMPNELPFGAVERPRPNEQIAGRLIVSGWAMDDCGIESVRIYVDARYVTDARLQRDRTDIARTYPRHARGSVAHGWEAQVDWKGAPGPHTVLIQAQDNQGSTRDLDFMTVILNP